MAIKNVIVETNLFEDSAEMSACDRINILFGLPGKATHGQSELLHAILFAISPDDISDKLPLNSFKWANITFDKDLFSMLYGNGLNKIGSWLKKSVDGGFKYEIDGNILDYKDIQNFIDVDQIMPLDISKKSIECVADASEHNLLQILLFVANTDQIDLYCNADDDLRERSYKVMEKSRDKMLDFSKDEEKTLLDQKAAFFEHLTFKFVSDVKSCDSTFKTLGSRADKEMASVQNYSENVSNVNQLWGKNVENQIQLEECEKLEEKTIFLQKHSRSTAEKMLEACNADIAAKGKELEMEEKEFSRLQSDFLKEEKQECILKRSQYSTLMDTMGKVRDILDSLKDYLPGRDGYSESEVKLFMKTKGIYEMHLKKLQESEKIVRNLYTMSYKRKVTAELEKLKLEKELLSLKSAELSTRVPSREYLNGLNGVKAVLRTFERERGAGFTSDYYGVLNDFCQCPPEKLYEMDKIAGNQLFTHYVKTEKFAYEIYLEMKKQKLPGAFACISDERMTQIPHNCIPDFVSYDKKWMKPLNFIFSTYFIHHEGEIVFEKEDNILVLEKSNRRKKITEIEERIRYLNLVSGKSSEYMSECLKHQCFLKDAIMKHRKPDISARDRNNVYFFRYNKLVEEILAARVIEDNETFDANQQVASSEKMARLANELEKRRDELKQLKKLQVLWEYLKEEGENADHDEAMLEEKRSNLRLCCDETQTAIKEGMKSLEEWSKRLFRQDRNREIVLEELPSLKDAIYSCCLTINNLLYEKLTEMSLTEFYDREREILEKHPIPSEGIIALYDQFTKYLEEMEKSYASLLEMEHKFLDSMPQNVSRVSQKEMLQQFEALNLEFQYVYSIFAEEPVTLKLCFADDESEITACRKLVGMKVMVERAKWDNVVNENGGTMKMIPMKHSSQKMLLALSLLLAMQKRAEKSIVFLRDIDRFMLPHEKVELMDFFVSELGIGRSQFFIVTNEEKLVKWKDEKMVRKYMFYQVPQMNTWRILSMPILNDGRRDHEMDAQTPILMQSPGFSPIPTLNSTQLPVNIVQTPVSVVLSPENSSQQSEISECME